jgi:hypothetical protein
MQIGQLYKIFETMGTPNEEDWPGVTSLRDWQPLFPQWKPKDLRDVSNSLPDPIWHEVTFLLDYT